jgi:hypothetical protein
MWCELFAPCRSPLNDLNDRNLRTPVGCFLAGSLPPLPALNGDSGRSRESPLAVLGAVFSSFDVSSARGARPALAESEVGVRGGESGGAGMFVPAVRENMTGWTTSGWN